MTGLDVVAQPEKVRMVIGLAGQYAAVDENLTGRENLELVSRLHHLGRDWSRQRIAELLARFELVDDADRPARTYSGGMRRRLDLAVSLVADPAVLFLDEPTTGLDPRSRLALWDVISSLRDRGTTIVLTTQYLEEADRLADQIVVIDGGRVIAAGTPDELKARVGGEVLEVAVADRSRTSEAAATLANLASGDPTTDLATGQIRTPLAHGAAQIAEALRRLDAVGLTPVELSLLRPSLDDVFLALTGDAVEVTKPNPVSTRGQRARQEERSVA